MKEDKKYYLKLMLTLFTAAALAILFRFLLSNIDNICTALSTVTGILMPFIIGGVIAYILTPLCNFFENRLNKILYKIKNGEKIAVSLSIILALLIAVSVVFAVLILVIPALVESIQSILLQIPSSASAFKNWAVKWAGDNEVLKNYINDMTKAISTNLPKWLSSTVLPYFQTAIGGVSAGVFGFIQCIL